MTESQWNSAGAAAKRFFERATVAPTAGGCFTVLLDDRPLRTPGKHAFEAPRAVAEAAAAEWAAQGERINPLSMPVTRAVNTAIERIAPQQSAVIDEIAGFGATDLVCYRAEAPAGLVEREAAAWDPLVAWCAEALGAELVVSAGLMHAPQPEAARAAIRRTVAAETDLGLAALHELTHLAGSVVIALALRRGRLDVEAAWAASRVDEEWQISQWGADAEAAEIVAQKKAAFHEAATLLRLIDAAA